MSSAAIADPGFLQYDLQMNLSEYVGTNCQDVAPNQAFDVELIC
jgi:hypothetical protein